MYLSHLTDDIKKLFLERKVYALATANGEGTPNVVPIARMKVLDDKTILISSQYMLKTLDNIDENPIAAIAIWKPGYGFQLKGEVEVHRTGDIFNYNLTWMKEVKPNSEPKAALLFHVKEIYSLSPGKHAGERITVNKLGRV